MEIIATALSSFAAVVIGILVTAFLPLRHEEQRWLHQQAEARRAAQLDCCARFLDLATRAFDLARVSAGQNRNLSLFIESLPLTGELTSDRKAHERLLREVLLDLRTPGSMIRLTCGSPVVQAYEDLTATIRDACQRIRAMKYRAEDWADLNQQFEARRDAFVEIAAAIEITRPTRRRARSR